LLWSGIHGIHERLALMTDWLAWLDDQDTTEDPVIDQADVLSRFRDICLALPETHETDTWGKPHFRVGEKIFAGYGAEDGAPTIGMKLTKAHQAERVKDPRFVAAKYVGRHGWVSMDATQITDWDDVRALVRESYRLIAPKRLVKLVEEP